MQNICYEIKYIIINTKQAIYQNNVLVIKQYNYIISQKEITYARHNMGGCEHHSQIKILIPRKSTACIFLRFFCTYLIGGGRWNKDWILKRFMEGIFYIYIYIIKQKKNCKLREKVSCTIQKKKKGNPLPIGLAN